MTSTTFEGITISSQFIGIGKRLDDDRYNAIYHILFPEKILLLSTMRHLNIPKAPDT